MQDIINSNWRLSQLYLQGKDATRPSKGGYVLMKWRHIKPRCLGWGYCSGCPQPPMGERGYLAEGSTSLLRKAEAWLDWNQKLCNSLRLVQKWDMTMMTSVDWDVILKVPGRECWKLFWGADKGQWWSACSCGGDDSRWVPVEIPPPLLMGRWWTGPAAAGPSVDKGSCSVKQPLLFPQQQLGNLWESCCV